MTTSLSDVVTDTCKWCGNSFEQHNRYYHRTTCSARCARLYSVQATHEVLSKNLVGGFYGLYDLEPAFVERVRPHADAIARRRGFQRAHDFVLTVLNLMARHHPHSEGGGVPSSLAQFEQASVESLTHSGKSSWGGRRAKIAGAA